VEEKLERPPRYDSGWVVILKGRIPQIFLTLKTRGQHRKYYPRAFTEHGILMLSSVLRSEQAVQVNIAIMRAFVRLKRWIGGNEELARRIVAIENKYDSRFWRGGGILILGSRRRV